MSFSSDSSSFDSTSSVGYPQPGISDKTALGNCSSSYEDDGESLAETNSSLSSSTEESVSPSVIYENISDSYCSDHSTDNSSHEFNLNEWLRLAKILVSKNQRVKGSPNLIQKYDELQEFFYFFAVEYYSTDQNLTEFVNNKRFEFIYAWEDVIGPCHYIFDFMVDLLDDVNVDTSFGTSFR